MHDDLKYFTCDSCYSLPAHKTSHVPDTSGIVVLPILLVVTRSEAGEEANAPPAAATLEANATPAEAYEAAVCEGTIREARDNERLRMIFF